MREAAALFRLLKTLENGEATVLDLTADTFNASFYVCTRSMIRQYPSRMFFLACINVKLQHPISSSGGDCLANLHCTSHPFLTFSLVGDHTGGDISIEATSSSRSH